MHKLHFTKSISQSRGLILSFLLIFLGCSDKNIPCPEFGVSSLSYRYSGSLIGTYFAAGETPPQNTSYTNLEWAFARTTNGLGKEWIQIYSHLPANNNGGHFIQMHLLDKSTGKFNLPSDFGKDVLVFNDGPDQTSYEFISGEINVTYYECERIIGTFHGEAKNPNGTDTITIQDGKFDVRVTN